MKRRKPYLFDHEATAAAGFMDPNSYIKRTKDGELHTFLFGADMTALRVKVFNRAGGAAELFTVNGRWEVLVHKDSAFCEMKIHGVLGHRCNRNVSWQTCELHHEPPKSQGGYDSPESTLLSCHRCQVVRHNRVTRFSQKAVSA